MNNIVYSIKDKPHLIKDDSLQCNFLRIKSDLRTLGLGSFLPFKVTALIESN